MKKSAQIRVFLLGGLGNQLFGTFFARALDLEFKGKVEISDRFIPFGSNPSRSLMVDQLPAMVIGNILLEKNSKFVSSLIGSSSTLRRIAWHLYRIFARKKRVNLDEFLELKSLPRNGIDILDYCDDWFFPEYVRNSNSRHPNISDMKFIPSELLKDIQDKIVCHVRIGDYLNHPDIYKLLPENYYFSAIEYLREKNSGLGYELLVITENKEEVLKFYPKLASKAKLIGQDELDSDLSAFYLMVNAKRLVAANSTFSMWAAWFGLQHRAETVVPDIYEGGLKNRGLKELKWTILNPTTGVREPNQEYESWYQIRKSSFRETMHRLKQN